MSKQLNINLGFTADTTQAKQQIMELRNNLNTLITSSTTKSHLPLTKQIMEAQSAAASLKVALDGAINTNTGKLDLSRFSTSLNKAGLDLKTLQAHLLKLGPTGASTFQSLATSIMRAEVPLTRTNAMMAQLWTTMKNTARWQLSSSMLHGFVSTVSSAFGYAKSLETSLNNIRIVTNNSVEEMARFAEQANKAAKALHTTTTAYTDASLIYYQQGLSGDEVKKRADITIKMANVSRQSAEIVSDQLTAVWNNFYDGTKSLEYYADAMTALGAATASSSEEIATGLEKFAAVAETVGLSYEYATAALATVTATTRQSADVVGTAFKTLFARLNDLKLGETLDDGTTLGQYTEHLAKIGVDIKDANDQLKDMDQILTETAAKWDTLDRGQQTALAKGVAGIRQYSQFIALMDNWDFMEENLKTVEDSGGTLSEQAEIFGESWEAAANRVKASAEDVFDSLIDDKAIKDLMKGFAGILDTVANLIDTMGGLPGVLSLIGIMMTKAFGPQLAASIERMAYNVKSLMGVNIKQATATQDQAYALTRDMKYTAGTEAGAAEAKVMGDQLKLQNALRENTQNMTEEERKRFEELMEINRAYGEQAILAAKAKDAAISKANETSGDIRKKVMRMDTTSGMDDKAKAQTYTKAREEMKKMAAEAATAQLNLEKVNAKLSAGGATNISGYNKQLEQVASTFDKLGRTDVGNKIRTAMASFKESGNMEKFQQTIQKIINSDELLADATMKASDRFRELLMSAGFSDEKIQKLMDDTDKLAAKEIELALKTKQAGEAMKGAGQNAEQLRQKIEGYKKAMQSWSQTIVSAFNGIASLSMALSSFKGLIDTLNNEDMTFGEKLLQSMTSLGMAVPALMFSLKGIVDLVKLVRAAFNAETISKGLNAAATMLQVVAEKKLKETKEKSAKATKKNKKATDKETVSKTANAGVTKLKDGFKNLGKGIGDWFKAYKGVLGKVGLVAAGIAIAAVSISAAIKHYNKDKLAAEQAAKNAQQAAEMYQSMSESYNKFTSSIESYDTAVEGLKDLQKGTLEYREAVLKANESILELIRNNKNLKYEVDDQGLIIIDPESLEEAKRTQLEILQNAQATKMIAEQTAKDAQLRADQTEFNRKYAKGSGWSSEDTAWVGGGVGAAAGAGLALGTVFGPIGAAIGAGVGLIVGAIGALAGDDSEKEEDEALEILKQAYNLKGNSIFTEEGIKAELEGKVSQDLINSLAENSAETQEMVTAMSANEAATVTLTEAMLRQQDPDKFKDDRLLKENEDKLWKITSKAVNDKAEKLYNTKYKDKGRLGGGLTDEEIQKEYAKRMGWDPNLVKNEGGNKAIYYNQDGQEVHLSDETVRRFLAKEEAEKGESNNDSSRLDAMIQMQQISLDNNTKFGEVLTSVVEDGTINNANKADIDFILNGKADDLVSEELLRTLGYENKEEYLTALKDGAELYGDQLIKAQKELTNTLDGAILQGMENLTLEDTKKINELLLTLSPNQKEKFLKDYNELINSVGEEDQGKLIQQLFDTDWSSVDSVEEFQKTLELLGSEIRITNDDWLEFQGNLQRGSGVPVLDTLISGFKQLKFYKQVEEEGNDKRDLSKEDYDKLDDDKKSNYTVIDVDDEGNPSAYRYVGDPTKDYEKEVENNISTLDSNTSKKNNYETTYSQEAIELIGQGDTSYKNKKTVSYGTEYGSTRHDSFEKQETGAMGMSITKSYPLAVTVMKGTGQKWEGSQEQAKQKLYNDYIEMGIIPENNDIPMLQVQTKKWDNSMSTPQSLPMEQGFHTATEGKWINDTIQYYPDTNSEQWKKIQKDYDSYVKSKNAIVSDSQQVYVGTSRNAFSLEQNYGALKYIEFGDDKKQGLKSYSDGLRSVASQYDSCEEELSEYNKVLANNALDSEKATKAEKKLINAVKDANWNRATKEIEEYLNTLSDTTDPEEMATAIQGIATSIHANLGAAVSPEWVEQNLELIKSWYGATGDEATQLALRIQALAALSSMKIEELQPDPIKLDIDGDGIENEFTTTQEKYQAIKTIIENNPIIIDGEGNIDVTALIASLISAGASAQTVADILASIGQTDIKIEGWGDAVKDFDLTNPEDQEAFAEYIKSITDWEGGVSVTGGYVPKQGVTDMSKVGETKTGNTKKKNRTIREKLKDDRDRTDVDEETERYYKITNEIEDLNRELDQLSNAKDDAWGPDRLKAMDKEIAKLKQVKEATKQYRDDIANKLKDDQKVLSEYGASFDENDVVSNYETLMASWASEKDSIVVDKYNEYEKQIVSLRNQAQNIDDDADADGSKRNALEDQIEDLETQRDDAVRDAEDLYDKRKKSLEQYEETRDLLAETNVELEEQLRKIQQFEYEKIMYKVEFKVEIDERALKVIDHKLKRLEDDFFKSAEAMAMIQSKADYYDEDQYQRIADGVDELKAKFEAGEITQAQYIEGLGQFQDMAMENVDALYEINDAMKEYYSNTLDAGMQKIKDMTQHFDNLSSRLQHYQSIVNLMGHEQNYDLQNKLLQSQIEVLNDKIETAKSTMTMLQDQLEQAKQNYANATTEEEKENWRQRIVDINNALMEEEDAYLGYVEEVGNAANQILTNSIEKAFKDVEDQMTNNLGFDSILNDMERMNTLTDEFLTNTNKMYETNKMIASTQSAIDKTSNLQAKQRYQDYIKYIEQLQTSGNLTQTELEIAQARYKVLEAEIALEEAKEAKDTVRLTRDAEGNFGYVYTANQDNVDEAQQNYLDAQNELYNIGLETTKDYREKIVNLQQQTLEDLKQLEIDYRVNHLMSEEEYEQQKAAIMETSQETLKTYQEQFNLGQFTMATNSYEGLEGLDSQYYNGVQTTATQTQKILEDNLANFNAGVLSAEDAQYFARASKDTKYYTDLKTLSSGIAEDINGVFNTNENSLAHELTVTFYNKLNTALTDCKDATDTWKTNMSELVEAVGLEFDGTETDEGLTQKIKNTLTESKNLSDYLNKKPDGLIDSIGSELSSVQEATLAWEAHWKEISTVIEYYNNLIDTIDDYIAKEAEGEEEEEEEISPPTTATSPTDTTSPADTTAAEIGDGVPEVGEQVTYTGGDYYETSNGTGRHGARGVGGTVEITDIKNGANFPIHVKSNNSAYGWLKESQISGYDTGGYTGEWGPEGKLALLHQKELVLNKQDTENFLTATQILREISDMLDHNALVASLGAINLGAMTIGTPADQILQQEVTIHADFPNVTDHNEIELAIDNLINAASQHAFKS